jgi:glycosyltransferase involved in cell wall biosynthesis
VSECARHADVALPSVTVVIPTHNRHELVAEAARSALAQDYRGPLEVLVVFDRETPFTLPVEPPPGRTLRTMSNDRTPGPAGAYNAGVIAASGEIVAFLDDDDEWLPQKIQLQVAALQAHPRSDVAVTGIFLGTGFRSARIPGAELLTLDHLLKGRRIEVHSSSVMVRREAYLDRIGLIDEDIPHSYGEDYDWHLRAARIAPIVAVRQPLVRVRWQYSYFADRWQTIIDGLTYQLDHRPEISLEKKNLARIYGRLAFANAALNRQNDARCWAARSFKADWREMRPYLTYLVTYRILRPEWVVRSAHALGRGI